MFASAGATLLDVESDRDHPRSVITIAGPPPAGVPRAVPGPKAVGARFFLIAFNVDLDTRDLAVAKRIAKEVRERDGGLPGIQALGFDLPERGWVQVSMNVMDYRKTSPIQAYDAVAERAKA